MIFRIFILKMIYPVKNPWFVSMLFLVAKNQQRSMMFFLFKAVKAIHCMTGWPVGVPWMRSFVWAMAFWRATVTKQNWCYIIISWVVPPPRIPVTTRIIIFLVGDPYKPSFATVTGRGDNPKYISKTCFTPPPKKNNAVIGMILFALTREGPKPGISMPSSWRRCAPLPLHHCISHFSTLAHWSQVGDFHNEPTPILPRQGK